MLKLDRETIKAELPFLTESVRWVKRRKNELSSLSRHLGRRKRQADNQIINKGKIVVVFICQYVPAWSKNRQLYETLKKDVRFKPYLLCVPDRVSGNHLRNPEDMSNDVYDYFNSRGYTDAINALIGRDEWYDLESLHPDYVIYNRYDRPMPVPYTSKSVSAYAKICLIMYGCALIKAADAMLDKPFAANTYCFFAESESKRKEFLRLNTVLAAMKLSRAECCGIIAVENAFTAKNDPCNSWDFSANSFRAIYAPRWTLEPIWGGSSFFEYKDTFFEIADQHPDIDILVRPHPLMFDHFVETGLMTKEEVSEYRHNCEVRKNIKLDTEKEYQAAFWNSSVLICDYTSMMIEYFVTGKPVIYLSYDENIKYTEQMDAMLQGSYIVKTESELKETIYRLLNGNDPLAEKRRQICDDVLIGSGNLSASENMKQILIDGYRA